MYILSSPLKALEDTDRMAPASCTIPSEERRNTSSVFSRSNTPQQVGATEGMEVMLGVCVAIRAPVAIQAHITKGSPQSKSYPVRHSNMLEVD